MFIQKKSLFSIWLEAIAKSYTSFQSKREGQSVNVKCDASVKDMSAVERKKPENKEEPNSSFRLNYGTKIWVIYLTLNYFKSTCQHTL